MANQEHIHLLKCGSDHWNAWRRQNPGVTPDLSGADLTHFNLDGMDFFETNFHHAILHHATARHAEFTRADLTGADLLSAKLHHADFCAADLYKAKLYQADLSFTNLSIASLTHANLTETYLVGANLSEANLTGAILSGTYLEGCQLTKANLAGANLQGCYIHGISAWDLIVDAQTVQENLIITPHGQHIITVDSIKIAQFIYLILNNEEVRHVIDTITSKVVLILGRFTPERKAVLDSIRNALRQPPFDFVPVIFDFEKPTSKGYTETVNTLANMARFVIADITDAKVILQELDLIVKNHPSVPVQPILLAGTPKNVIVSDFELYGSFLPIYEYSDEAGIIEALSAQVITPAEQLVRERRGKSKT
ncbi:MAG TPA: pentapeptide repeat-containing protein [Chthonomonadaceae bacterium]|nr:pentapeptide repeat-containing protein [Chthonomonadaceae bacterium]